MRYQLESTLNLFINRHVIHIHWVGLVLPVALEQRGRKTGDEMRLRLPPTSMHTFSAHTTHAHLHCTGMRAHALCFARLPYLLASVKTNKRRRARVCAAIRGCVLRGYRLSYLANTIDAHLSRPLCQTSIDFGRWTRATTRW